MSNRRIVRPLTDCDRATIEAMHLDGEAFNEIGRAIGRTPTVVSRYLARVGLHEIRPRPRHVDEAIHLYLLGVSVSVIRRRCGVSSGTLYNELKRRGITPRYPAIAAAVRRRFTQEAQP